MYTQLIWRESLLLNIQRNFFLIKKCFIDQKKTKSCKHLFTLYITDPKNPYQNLLAPVIMNSRILYLVHTPYLYHKITLPQCATTFSFKSCISIHRTTMEMYRLALIDLHFPVPTFSVPSKIV